MSAALAARVLALLPQTQCTRCGYPDCAAYASAIAQRAAAINQCPPGGAQGIERLAAVTGMPASALNPAHGREGPRSVAFVDEAWCIGCTLCIKVCPTDAIIGSSKLMHTVLEACCTGCELCLPVCPVDCIELENVSGTATGWSAWSQQQADEADKRYEFHQLRSRRAAAENELRLEQKAVTKLADLTHHSQHTDPAVLDQKRAVIEAALARARLKRESGQDPKAG
ncbi:MAG: electron transport complex subunit RsxB [Rhodoferax sp.]